MRPLFVAAVRIVAAGIALTWWSAEATTQPRYGGVLRRGVVGRLELPRVRRPQTPSQVELSRLLHAGLYRFGEDGEPAPDLVERAEILSSGSRVRLTLVEAQFHDGQPVTSADVKESIRQSAGQASLLGRVGHGGDPVVIEDPRTLLLDVSGAPGLWPWVLAGVEMSILPVGGDGRKIGAGPFALAEAGEGTLQLEAYGRHHRGRPRLDAIVYESYKDERALLFAHRHRGLHVADTIGEGSAAGSPGVVSETVLLRVDGTIDGLRDAVAHAVEREALVDVVLGGNGRAATGLLVPRQTSKPKQAERVATRQMQSVRVLYSEESGLRRIAERLRVDLQRVGLSVTLGAVEAASLWGPIKTGTVGLVPLVVGGIPLALQLAEVCRRFDQNLPGAVLQIAKKGLQDGTDGGLLSSAEQEIEQAGGLVVLFQRDRRVDIADSVQDARIGTDGVLVLEEAWLWPPP